MFFQNLKNSNCLNFLGNANNLVLPLVILEYNKDGTTYDSCETNTQTLETNIHL